MIRSLICCLTQLLTTLSSAPPVHRIDALAIYVPLTTVSLVEDVPLVSGLFCQLLRVAELVSVVDCHCHSALPTTVSLRLFRLYALALVREVGPLKVMRMQLHLVRVHFCSAIFKCRVEISHFTIDRQMSGNETTPLSGACTKMTIAPPKTVKCESKAVTAATARPSGGRRAHAVVVTRVPSALCASEDAVRQLFAAYGALSSVTVRRSPSRD